MTVSDVFDSDDEENTKTSSGIVDSQNFITDIREFDVPYHVRVAIDRGPFAIQQFTNS